MLVLEIANVMIQGSGYREQHRVVQSRASKTPCQRRQMMVSTYNGLQE